MLNIGLDEIKNVKVGNTQIKKIMYNDQIVWPRNATVPDLMCIGFEMFNGNNRYSNTVGMGAFQLVKLDGTVENVRNSDISYGQPYKNGHLITLDNRILLPVFILQKNSWNTSNWDWINFFINTPSYGYLSVQQVTSAKWEIYFPKSFFNEYKGFRFNNHTNYSVNDNFGICKVFDAKDPDNYKLIAEFPAAGAVSKVFEYDFYNNSTFSYNGKNVSYIFN